MRGQRDSRCWRASRSAPRDAQTSGWSTECFVRETISWPSHRAGRSNRIAARTSRWRARGRRAGCSCTPRARDARPGPTAGYMRSTVGWYGGVGLLAGQVLRNLALPPKYGRLVVEQIEVMGVRSMGVALIAAGFTGMVLALQSGVNMARFGAETYVGPLVALSMLRELGPVLTAILVGGKVASGITAELGSMLVTEQIDALRSLGVNYIKRLVVPRVLAALIVFPLLTILADGVGLMGGAVIAVFERGVDWYAFWNTTLYWVTARDFLTGV